MENGSCTQIDMPVFLLIHAFLFHKETATYTLVANILAEPVIEEYLLNS